MKLGLGSALWGETGGSFICLTGGDQELFSVQPFSNTRTFKGRTRFSEINVVFQVVQFGADCDQDECTCRDPDAEENKAKSKQTQDAGGGVQ